MSDASDIAFSKWLESSPLKASTRPALANAKVAFEAGWEARKAAQYRDVVGVDAGVEPAFYGPWVPPRENPRDKLFKPDPEDKS